MWTESGPERAAEGQALASQVTDPWPVRCPNMRDGTVERWTHTPSPTQGLGERHRVTDAVHQLVLLRGSYLHPLLRAPLFGHYHQLTTTISPKR